MIKSVHCLLLFALSFTVFIACQKELSFENEKPAVASLRSDSTGDCLPKIVKGTFVAGRALGDSNTLEVELDVTTPGSYTISTDSVNGYVFRGTGSVSNAGISRIVLKGIGTPLLRGTDAFTLNYGTSMCTIQVNVLDAGNAGPAVFFLGSTALTCAVPTPSGTYSQGTALTSANRLTVPINATAAGTYTLSTDTVNGFYFTSSGAILNTGLQILTLNGGGTPVRSDTTTFTLRSGTQVCTFKIFVGATAPPPPPPTGNCVDTVLGSYVTTTALTAANRVQLRHTFLAAGVFIVSTNTVNGYNFRDTVVVSTPGTLANLDLNGSGTPITTGINTFAITFGDGTSCSFNVTVTATVPPPPPPPPVTTGVYFPLTYNSYWTYGEQSSGDTIKRLITDSVQRAGNLYKLFVETDMVGDTTQYFYRRSANDYLEYAFVDNYSLITFTEFLYGDILFMKEGLTTGQTWNSTVWTGTDNDDSLTKKLRYVFTCTDAAATVTVGTSVFPNVYKVTFKSQTAPGNSNTFTDEGLSWDAWYARGVGLVLLKANLTGFPVSPYELRIRNWVVR